jgi:predicted RNase H-like HicB family nuclease
MAVLQRKLAVTIIHMYYIWESAGWSAQTPDVPNWSAAAATFAEVRELAVEAMTIEFGSAFRLKETVMPRSGLGAKMVDHPPPRM